METPASEPYFSIIIPSYNRADLIGKSILSVLDQSFRDFIILIIDDCSTDNTREVIGQFNDPRIQYYRNEKNLERSASRNKGIQLATGKYITFLDSDDYYYPGHLQKSYDQITAHRSDLFFQRYEVVDQQGKSISESRLLKKNVFAQLLKEGTILHLNGLFIRNDIARQTPFREDMNQSEDYEFFIRLLLSHSLNFSNEITSALLQHDTRGVLTINKISLLRNKELLIHYIESNPAFMSSCKKYLKHIKSGAYSYISLHLVLTGDLRGGMVYFFRSLYENPVSFFRRRSFAIIKHTLKKILS